MPLKSSVTLSYSENHWFRKKKEDIDQTFLVMYKTTASDKKFITCRRKTLNITVIKDIVVLQR